MGANLDALSTLDPRWPKILRECREFEGFCRWLKIRPEEGGRLVQLTPNEAQLRIKQETRGHQRVLILKGRRLGVTTLRLAYMLHQIWKRRYTECVMVAHRNDDATEIFQSAQIMHDNLPDALRHHRPTLNRRELFYDTMGSRISVGTAGGVGVKRGSALQHVHLTEAAFYPKGAEVLINGLMEASRAGQMFAETTANGASGWFYDKWMENRDGEGPWKCLFAPWWWDDRNRLRMTEEDRRAFVISPEEQAWIVQTGQEFDISQVAWYRFKKTILGRLMAQEYPNSDLEAFTVSGRHYFDQEWVLTNGVDLPEAVELFDGLKGKIWEPAEEGVKYVIGADTSEGTPSGDFSYASVHRRDDGRQVARWRGKVTPPTFAAVLAKLGRRYNRALIAVERNQPECVRVLRKGQMHAGKRIPAYRKLFHRRSPQTREPDPRPGWQTDGQTRPLMLAHLKDALEGDRESGREGWLILRDSVPFTEMTTFEEQPGGKYAAPSGKHDDSIIAIAIAMQARQHPKAQVRFID